MRWTVQLDKDKNWTFIFIPRTNPEILGMIDHKMVEMTDFENGDLWQTPGDRGGVFLLWFLSVTVQCVNI